MTNQRGQLILEIAASGPYFSQEMGIILEDRDGLSCRVTLPAANLRRIGLDQRGDWRALEAGICDAADGSCTPVRIELSAWQRIQRSP